MDSLSPRDAAIAALHGRLVPLEPGRRVFLKGGRKRPMIVDRIEGYSALCSWWFNGKMYRDWFAIAGLVVS